MKEITMTFEEIKGKVLDLGHMGDTGNQKFKFDCLEFFKDAVEKFANLILSKPDGTAEEIQLTIEDDMPVWQIGTGVTDVAGFGEYQITISDGTKVLSSPCGRYFVGRVLEVPDPPTPPEPDPEPEPEPEHTPDPDEQEGE